MKNTSYVQNYTAFMDSYNESTSAVGVGLLITKLAGEFVLLNLELVSAERALAFVAKENELLTDENGKPISSAKAKVMTEGSEEALTVMEFKAHKENLRVLIASLDSLLKGMIDGRTV